jgi:hypothetical protein
VPDTPEVFPEMALYLDGHTVLEQILLLGDEFRRKIPDALFRIFAIGCAAEIQLRIHEAMPALGASSSGVILEKLHLASAFRAFGLKNSPRLPVPAVLSRAFHDNQTSIKPDVVMRILTLKQQSFLDLGQETGLHVVFF